MVTNIPQVSIQLTILGIELINAIILTIRSVKLKSKDLGFLVGFFICSICVSVYYSIPDSLTRDVGFTFSLLVENCFLIVFTHRTFYSGKKVHFLYFS